VLKLKVGSTQEGFVAPNAVSLAQALFSKEAWYRAIYADDVPAGFVMVYDETLREEPPAEPRAGLWRFMVDERYQGRGIGRAALDQVIAHIRAKGCFSAFETSYVPGPGCPEPFYLKAGFHHTGRMDGTEVVLELPLAP